MRSRRACAAVSARVGGGARRRRRDARAKPLSASAARAGSREANDAGGDRRQSSRPSSVKPQPSSGSVEDAASGGTLSMSRSSGERALPHAKNASRPRRDDAPNDMGVRASLNARREISRRRTKAPRPRTEDARETNPHGDAAARMPIHSVKHARRFFSRQGPMACDVAARSAEQWGNLTRHSRVAISPSEVWLACP